MRASTVAVSIARSMIVLSLFASGVSATPVEFVTLDGTSPQAAAEGLWTCDVFLQFDGPDDLLLSIAFADITTDDPLGFFQVPAAMGGSDTAPLELLLDIFPDLVFDSYLTISLEIVAMGVNDCTSLDADFISDFFNNHGQIVGGWWCNNPPSGQGLVDPEHMQIFVARWTVRDGYSIAGDVTVFYNDASDPVPLPIQCVQEVPCIGNINGDGAVDPADLALLLGSWGPNPGPADLNHDNAINAADLALLIAHYGPCA